jgi:hypothetical protein
VIGSPSGLPLKVAGGAQVRGNSHPFFFTANLDTFQGNSGSAVFNAETGMVEGILVRGEEDYQVNMVKGCIEAKACTDVGCRGEDVSRLTSLPEIALQKPLYFAATTGNLDLLKKILETRFWIDFYGHDGQSAFLKAAEARQDKVLTILLTKGADPLLKDVQGNGALHLLAKNLSKKDAEVLDTLLFSELKLEEVNAIGQTPLLVAAENLNLDGVKLLLSKGANKDATDKNGTRLIDPFIKNSDLEAVAELSDLIDPKIELKALKKLTSFFKRNGKRSEKKI